MSLAGRTFVLFDFDGTLANTAPAIMGLAHRVLLEWGMPEERLTRENMLKIVGPSFPGAFEVAFGLSHEEAEEVTERYRRAFSQGEMEPHELFPGVPELLRALKGEGKRLAIVTSRRLWQVRLMAGGDGILEFFDVVGGQDINRNESKAELIARALGELGCAGSDAVMVGDRGLDVEGATANGMPCVGCLFGTAARDELEAAGATAIVEDMGGLSRLLTVS